MRILLKPEHGSGILSHRCIIRNVHIQRWGISHLSNFNSKTWNLTLLIFGLNKRWHFSRNSRVGKIIEPFNKGGNPFPPLLGNIRYLVKKLHVEWNSQYAFTSDRKYSDSNCRGVSVQSLHLHPKYESDEIP